MSDHNVIEERQLAVIPTTDAYRLGDDHAERLEKKLSSQISMKLIDVMEARVGIEPTHKGFADLSLTTWVPRLIAYAAHFLCLEDMHLAFVLPALRDSKRS